MEIVKYHYNENMRRRKLKDSTSSKSRGESSISLPEIDIYADHWLVESPRKLLYEKTQLSPSSSLFDDLETFYERKVVIPQARLDTVRQRAKELIVYLTPRIIKLAQQTGMKIKGMKFAGSVYDDTQVVRANEVDILVEFESNTGRKLESSKAGYFLVPLKKYNAKPGEPPDPHRYARCEDGKYLSSYSATLNLHDLVQKALKVHPVAKLEPFTINQGKCQITVRWKKTRFHLTPATCVGDEDYKIVTRPYDYDEHTSDKLVWRVSCSSNEKRILESMDHADRGVRRKAFKILKALVKLEHTLQSLTSYQLKTVLFHAFDCTVDVTPRWQRESVDHAFLVLLEELHHFLTMWNLPHFFVNEYNLFSGMETRKVQALQTRVSYLLKNPNELVRILQKHSHAATNHVPKVSLQKTPT